ncbi:hypothetical protein A3Q56_05592 [Intoshia linei]|uniref:Uncharacterized protein n=1 Tax=Intoshia linei TaxID=1819745 RepID=A0A177AX72_9BILA|nr:hypothetical protein A3Q56_05592 [Intoshia linei]
MKKKLNIMLLAGKIRMVPGESIEYMIVHFDDKNRKAQFSLKSPEIREYFGNIEQKYAAKGLCTHHLYVQIIYLLKLSNVMF